MIPTKPQTDEALFSLSLMLSILLLYVLKLTEVQYHAEAWQSHKSIIRCIVAVLSRLRSFEIPSARLQGCNYTLASSTTLTADNVKITLLFRNEHRSNFGYVSDLRETSWIRMGKKLQ